MEGTYETERQFRPEHMHIPKKWREAVWPDDFAWSTKGEHRKYTCVQIGDERSFWCQRKETTWLDWISSPKPISGRRCVSVYDQNTVNTEYLCVRSAANLALSLRSVHVPSQEAQTACIQLHKDRAPDKRMYLCAATSSTQRNCVVGTTRPCVCVDTRSLHSARSGLQTCKSRRETSPTGLVRSSQWSPCLCGKSAHSDSSALEAATVDATIVLGVFGIAALVVIAALQMRLCVRSIRTRKLRRTGYRTVPGPKSLGTKLRRRKTTRRRKGGYVDVSQIDFEEDEDEDDDV